jgi:DNA-binding CsgD family transcriptional regulator
MEEARMPQTAFLKNRFGLTPAEARLVQRLVSGDSLRSAAKALGIKYETVRTTSSRFSRKPERAGRRRWSSWSFAR